MGLEDCILAAESECGRMERRWAGRQRLLKLPFRMFFSWPYWASINAPGDMEGPALVVFAEHNYSSDPVFLVSQSGFRASVAREGFAPLSVLAAYFGGVMVPGNKGKEALKVMKERLHFHLGRAHVIEVFPFADVNGDARHGIVRSAMQWERETGRDVKYFQATLQYSTAVPFLKQPVRMPLPLSGWPVPLITQATLFVGMEHHSSKGFPPNSKGAQEFVKFLVSEADLLPGQYQKNRQTSSFYMRARQFFLG